MAANPEYPQQIEHLRDDMQTGRAVLVYLDRYARTRQYYPKADELKKRLGLHPLARRRDGTIYDYVAPPATATGDAVKQ